MATDIFIREGLNSQQMAELCKKYRDEFDIKHVELVDIVDLLEFRMPELYPGFRLLIKPNDEVADHAISDPLKKQIIVRESVYDSACDGDAFCRFVLAHELGHFLLHAEKGRVLHKSSDPYSSSISKMNAKESAETQADMFAAFFLIDPKLAHSLRGAADELALRTGTPIHIAKGVISGSKRFSFRNLTHSAPKSFAQRERDRKSVESPDDPAGNPK